MAKVGYICHNLRVHPRGRPSDEVPLDNLGGSAGDLLLLLHKRTSELVTAGDSFRDEDADEDDVQPARLIPRGGRSGPR